MKKLQLIVVLLFITSITFAQEALLGKWLTQDQDAIVEIYESDGKYFGKVVKLIPATHEDGSTIVDAYNPDKALQSRELLGANTILNFEWDANNQKLVNGKVYDPKNGKTYRGKIWVEDGKLMLRGYVAMFHRTEAWVRVTS